MTGIPSLHIRTEDQLDLFLSYEFHPRYVEVAVRHVARRSSFLPGSSALRQLVAIICATAMLAVGFAHCLHHFDTSGSTALSQSDAEPPTRGPDAPNHVAGDADHCHGCTMLATLLEEPTAAPLIAAKFALSRLDGAPDHRAVVEPPPPKFAI